MLNFKDLLGSMIHQGGIKDNTNLPWVARLDCCNQVSATIGK
jgi:hypothetical protein